MEALILRGAIAERICKSVITYNVTVNGADDTRFSMVWSNISLFAKETESARRKAWTDQFVVIM